MNFLLTVFGTILGFFLPGFLIVKLFYRDVFSKTERVVFSFGISIGILHILLILFFILRIKVDFYKPFFLLLVLTIMLIYFCTRRRQVILLPSKLKFPETKDVKICISKVKEIKSSLAIIWIIIAIYYILMFIQTYYVPIFGLSDTLEYYAVYPRYVFENGYYPFSDIYAPFVYSEIRLPITLGTWTYLCFGKVLENISVLTVFISVLTLLFVYSFAKRVTENSLYSLAAASLLLLSPEFVLRSMHLHVDVMFSFMFSLAVFSFYFYLKGNKNLTYLCGFLLGSAITSKFTAILIFFSLIPIFLYFLLKKNKEYGKDFFKIFVTVSVLVLPLFVNNYVTYGNPVYPMMYRTLGGDEWTGYILTKGTREYLLEKFNVEDRRDYIKVTFERLINLKTIFPDEKPKFGDRENLFLILFFGVSVLNLVIRINRRENAFMLILISLYILWWVASFMGYRQLLPLLPVVLPFLFYMVRKDIRNILLAVVLVSVFFHPILSTFLGIFGSKEYSSLAVETGFGQIMAGKLEIDNVKNIFKVLKHKNDREYFLKDRWRGMYDSWEYVRKLDDHNILVADPRIYYIDNGIWHFNKDVNRIYLAKSEKEILWIMEKFDIKYVYFNMVMLNYGFVKRSLFVNMLSNKLCFKEIYKRGMIKVYEVEYACIQQ